MNIKIINAAGELITINPGKNNDITENSTINELIKAYAKRYAEEIEEELDDKKIKEAVLEAEHNFEFKLGKLKLDNNKTLKQLLEGEVIITASRRTPSIAECLSDINKLDSTSSQIQTLTKIKEILEREIYKDRKEVTPIFASSDKDIVLAAVQQNGKTLYFASPLLRADREIVLAAVR